MEQVTLDIGKLVSDLVKPHSPNKMFAYSFQAHHYGYIYQHICPNEI